MAEMKREAQKKQTETELRQVRPYSAFCHLSSSTEGKGGGGGEGRQGDGGGGDTLGDDNHVLGSSFYIRE